MRVSVPGGTAMTIASRALSACCALALLGAVPAASGAEFDPVYHAAPDAGIGLRVIGRYDGGVFSTSLANTPPAYDDETKRLFVISNVRQAVEVLDLSDPRTPEKV